MKIAVYSCHDWELPFLQAANEAGAHELRWIEARLSLATVESARGCEAAALFGNDDASAAVLGRLRELGIRLLCLRSAGFNHVDVAEAERLGLTVLRVPAYSPHAIAEHTVGMILTLNRKFHRAFNRVREQNFALSGLMGFDLHGKTVGVVGTGRIGACVCRILLGFGCRVLAHDPVRDPDCEAAGVRYVELAELLRQSQVVTLHCPLTPATRHLIDGRALDALRPGAMLVNTSRGGILDTRALIVALKAKRLGAVGLDVYEEEGDLFFHDLSEEVIQDDVFMRLLTFPNVLVTAHQAFFTREAVSAIASTTIANASAFERGAPPPENRVTTRLYAAPRAN